MTDQPQMIPADPTRTIVANMRAAMRRDEHAYPEAKFLADLSGYINDLEALLPDRPTMADIPEEERPACQWMQADTKLWGRVVIVLHNAGGGRAVTINRRGHVAYEDHADVTPRPDLPRLEWPGDEKPAPAPALPDGWRLADHKDNGRVIVTTQTPNAAGNVYFVIPDGGDRRGHRWRYCPPTDLTYIDREGDTPTGPDTLAVGSEWDDADALARACEESGRDQIIALDRAGDAYVWSEASEWWEIVSPMSMNAPFTIIHAGKKADQ